MNRRRSIAACLLLALSFGCSTPPRTLDVRLAGQVPPPPPAYVAEAVARFVGEHPGWSVRWQQGSGMPRLLGQPAVPVAGVEFVPGAAPDRAAMGNAFTQIVATYRDALGLRGLEATFDAGAAVGNLWLLRGNLVREGVPVSGRIDCGLTLEGKLAWLSSRVPPGIDEVGIAESRSREAAESDALEFAGLTERDRERVDRDATRLLVWWHEASATPTQPALAYRVAIRADPERDKAGGTYVIDAHEPRLLQFLAARRIASAVPVRPRAAPEAPEVPESPTVAPAARASERAVEPRLVRALVRTGTGAHGATSLEPMPFLDVEWTTGGATKPVPTDAYGMLAIDPAPGDTIATKLTGGCVAGHVPAVPFTFVPGAGFDVVDAAGESDLLDRATVRHWFTAAHARLAPVCDPSVLEGLRWLWCSYPRLPEQGCYQDGRIYLSAACHGWPSWCFDTMILHEWAHALDEAFHPLEPSDDVVAEAWADIVAMFVSGQP